MIKQPFLAITMHNVNIKLHKLANGWAFAKLRTQENIYNYSRTKVICLCLTDIKQKLFTFEFNLFLLKYNIYESQKPFITIHKQLLQSVIGKLIDNGINYVTNRLILLRMHIWIPGKLLGQKKYANRLVT